MSGIALRPYQREALDAIAQAERRGVRSQLVALPTGTGKTVIFSELIRQHPGSALILAHRDELLKQAADKLSMVAPELGLSVGFVKAERNDVGAPVVVASVQTLARQRRLAQLPAKWDRVIVDEAHHGTAASYRRILDHVDAPLVVGFTATPERHDKSRLADVFEEIVYARGLLEMIEQGYLANLTGLRVELADLDLGSVKVSRGDYQAEDLSRALRAAGAPAHTAVALTEHALDRKSIVFVPTVALAHETAAAIDAAGIPAAALDGTTPDDERAAIIRRLAAGELRCVVNVDVLTEGFDEPSVDCIAIAAPTRSRIAYVQRVGRGTRIHPHKSDCLVLDLAGVTEDLKLQSLPALFDLEASPKRGETVTDAIAREAAAREEAEAKQASAEKRRARKAELFGRDRLHWIEVSGRWVLSAGEGELLVLDEVRDGAYRVLLVGAKSARILARDLDLGYAQGAAEEAVRAREAVTLADTKASWRRQPASAGQLAYLARLGVTAPVKTKGEASDAINEAVARQRLERLDAALAERDERAAVTA